MAAIPPQLVEQLLQCLQNANSPDNAIQTQVREALDQLAQQPVFPMALTQLFVEQGRPELVRQMAGLLLKKQIDLNLKSIDASLLPHIKQALLTAVLDANETVRKTAGSIITTLITRGGAWIEALQTLTDSLGNSDPNIVDGCLSALDKIVEDALEQQPPPNDPFLQFSAQVLVPKIFHLLEPSVPVAYRRIGMKVVNHYVLKYHFDQGQPLNPFQSQYKAKIGALAVGESDATVLQYVCQGLVHLCEHAPQEIGADAPGVLNMLLQACKHESYDVRYHALEIWSIAAMHPAYWEAVRGMLAELVPTLLQNMVYSKYDYETMDAAMTQEDNAAVPDTEADCAPRFHAGKNDEKDDDEDGGQGSAWGTDWTVRKAAASSLDTLANAFSGGILPHLLPHIEGGLKASQWEVQESVVLALGAIAHGCVHELAPHLPQVMGLLIGMCSAEKPLLRSISCWCVSRYSGWIVNGGEPAQPFLAPALAAVLGHVLDRNKRVQEAACSAFATMEEDARQLLVPFLPEIVPKVLEAYKFYQAKNLLILYDATGTMAECVGAALDKPEYYNALLPPIFARLDSVPDTDRSLVALFECLTQLAHTLHTGFQPYAERTVARCFRILRNSLDQCVQAKQLPEQFDLPDREIMAAAIDAISGVAGGMGPAAAGLLQTPIGGAGQPSVIQMVPLLAQVEMVQVKQATFALVGDLAKNQPATILQSPAASEIIQHAAANLNSPAPAVQNNASWAIGEICVQAGPEAMKPHAMPIATALTQTLMAADPNRAHVFTQNTCITIGRLALVAAAEFAPTILPQIAQRWCQVIISARNDGEKANAFHGMCLMVQSAPAVLMEAANLFWFFKAVASFRGPSPDQVPPQHVRSMLGQVLAGYKQSYQNNPAWGQVWSELQPQERQGLTEVYGIT